MNIITVIMATAMALVLPSCGSDKTSSGPAESTACASLAGTWSIHRLETAASGSGSWAHSTENIGSDCSGTELSVLDSSGNTALRGVVTYSLDGNGIVTRSDNPSFLGMVLRNNQVFVATRTAGGGSAYRLVIGMKNGGPYAQTDLAGTHTAHLLRSGASPLWAYGTVTIDSAGAATSVWTESNGATAPGNPSTQTLSPAGVITDSLNATWHGTISANRDMMVATATMGSSFDLIVAAPDGGTFSPSDLVGSWRWHFLQTGAGHAAWVRGRLQSDLNGNVTQLWQEDSGGGTTPGAPFTWSIDTNGLITRSDGAGYHGVMLGDKKTIVSTRNSGDGLGFRLTISRKE